MSYRAVFIGALCIRGGRCAVLSWILLAAGVVELPQASGGLVDFMFNGCAPPPTEVCYPTTPVYQAMESECCEPNVQFQSPDASCCPPTMVQPQSSCGFRWPSCLSRGNSYSEPAYRTTWKTVPVTSYRPVTMTDHATGCPVTVMKPCTTYAWQADRRPCGFFDRLFGQCDEAQPCAPMCTSMPTDCMEGMVTSGGFGSTTVVGEPTPAVPTPAGTPYYSPSPPSVLTTPTPAPGSAVPPAASQPPTLNQPPSSTFPGYAPPATAPVAPPAAPTAPPAARTRVQRPTLQPYEPTPATPESATPEPATPESFTAQQPPRVRLPISRAPVAETPATDGGMLEGPSLGMPSLGMPLIGPGGTQTSPVPSPDATPRVPAEAQPTPATPQPNDQVASWNVAAPVRYASAVRPVAGRVVPERSATVSATRDIRNLDESGWRSRAK